MIRPFGVLLIAKDPGLLQVDEQANLSPGHFSNNNRPFGVLLIAKDPGLLQVDEQANLSPGHFCPK